MDNPKNKLNEFIKSIPEANIKFDYFTLFEHISNNKLDKENIIKFFKDSKTNLTIGNSNLDLNNK
jgi:hypothetical protein